MSLGLSLNPADVLWVTVAGADDISMTVAADSVSLQTKRHVFGNVMEEVSVTSVMMYIYIYIERRYSQ